MLTHIINQSFAFSPGYISSLANGILYYSSQGLLLHSSKWQKISDIDNYRPLSVTSILAKVFERIIHYQLFANLLDHNIKFLSKHQSGIHVLHSAITAFN